MNIFKMDFVDQPITIIKVDENTFKFYPVNLEASTAYLEFEKEKKALKEKNYCGAV